MDKEEGERRKKKKKKKKEKRERDIYYVARGVGEFYVISLSSDILQYYVTM